MQSNAGTPEDKDNIQCISKWSFPWSMSTRINTNFDIRQDNIVILDDFQQWLSLGVPEAVFTGNLYNSHWSCSGKSLTQMLFPAERRTHLSFSESSTVCLQEPCQLTYQYQISQLLNQWDEVSPNWRTNKRMRNWEAWGSELYLYLYDNEGSMCWMAKVSWRWTLSDTWKFTDTETWLQILFTILYTF